MPNVNSKRPYRFVGSNFFLENRTPDSTPPPPKQSIIPRRRITTLHSPSFNAKTNCVIFPVKWVAGIKNSNKVNTLTIPDNILNKAIQISK